MRKQQGNKSARHNAGGLGLIVAIAAQGLAHAGTFTTTIVNQKSGLCLVIPDASGGTGLVLQQRSCNGTKTQSYTFVRQTDGLFVIKTGTGSNLCLDATGPHATGGPVYLNQCNGSSTQEWKYFQNFDGTYMIQTPDNGCLDVWQASTSAGGHIDTYACNGTGAQEFQISGIGGG